MVNRREKALSVLDLVRDVQAAGAAIFLQIGHGGLYSMEAWHEPYASQRQGPLLAASPAALRAQGPAGGLGTVRGT